jgi:hypothetical protein
MEATPQEKEMLTLIADLCSKVIATAKPPLDHNTEVLVDKAKALLAKHGMDKPKF